MALYDAKAGTGSSNLGIMYSLNAGGTGIVTPAIFTFDRIVTNGISGTVQKKNMAFNFDHRERSAALDAIFDTFLSDTTIEVSETFYEDGNKTKQTDAGTTVPFVMVYFEATAKGTGDVGVYAVHGVFSGACGDPTNTGKGELNGTVIEMTGTETSATITVDATAFPATVVLTPTAIVINQNQMGNLVYQSHA